MKKVIAQLIYIGLLPLLLMSCNDDIFMADYIVPDTAAIVLDGNGEGSSIEVDGRKMKSVRIVTAFTCDFTMYDSDDWVVATSTGHEAELNPKEVAYARLHTSTFDATVSLSHASVYVWVEENMSQSVADFNLICAYTNGSEFKIPVEVTPGAGYAISDVKYDFSSATVGEEYAGDVSRRMYYNNTGTEMTIDVSPCHYLTRGLLMEFDYGFINIMPGGQMFEIPTLSVGGQVGLYNIYGAYDQGQLWFMVADKDDITLTYTLPAGCNGEVVLTPYMRDIKVRYEAEVINSVSGRIREAAGLMTVSDPVRYDVEFIITE